MDGLKPISIKDGIRQVEWEAMSATGTIILARMAIVGNPTKTKRRRRNPS